VTEDLSRIFPIERGGYFGCSSSQSQGASGHRRRSEKLFAHNARYFLITGSGLIHSPIMEKEPKPRRVTLVLRNDLNERAIKRAAELGQNPNNFVNLCVEGCLDAMDDDKTTYQIPIITLDRIKRKRTLLDSEILRRVVEIFAPKAEEITAEHHRFFAELINQHEGPLNPELMQFYWRRAAEMNKQRIETEKELAKLKKPKGSGK
jgi:hypothetical protein